MSRLVLRRTVTGPDRNSARRTRPLTGLVALLALGAGACSGADAPLPRAPEPIPSTSVSAAPRTGNPLDNGQAGQLQPYGDAQWPAYAVTPRGARLAVSATPGGPVSRTFSARTTAGGPTTFLLVGRRAGWLQVELPVRPNGATGWVRGADARLAGLRYSLEVSRGDHLLRVYDHLTVARTYPVGIGTRETPTPGGLYYLAELLRPPDPSGAYGPYAYGLNGFSTVLRTFNGGDGVIGLHGTNQPSTVGSDVSHGCIRLRNADISALVSLLALGTPIRIVA